MDPIWVRFVDDVKAIHAWFTEYVFPDPESFRDRLILLGMFLAPILGYALGFIKGVAHRRKRKCD